MRLWLLVGLALVIAACGGSSGDGGAACTATKPCGGSVAGTWNVSSSCVRTGPVKPVCPTSTEDLRGVRITGTMTFTNDSTYTRAVTISGAIVDTVPSACLAANGVTPTCEEVAQAAQQSFDRSLFQSLVCANARNGRGCDCTATLVPVAANQSGTYSTAGSTLDLTHDGATDTADYCVQGSQLSVTDQEDTTIFFLKE